MPCYLCFPFQIQRRALLLASSMNRSVRRSRPRHQPSECLPKQDAPLPWKRLYFCAGGMMCWHCEQEMQRLCPLQCEHPLSAARRCESQGGDYVRGVHLHEAAIDRRARAIVQGFVLPNTCIRKASSCMNTGNMFSSNHISIIIVGSYYHHPYHIIM